MKCSRKNAAGKPCGAPAEGTTNSCVMHSGKAAELGSKGGRHNPDTYSSHFEKFVEAWGRQLPQLTCPLKFGPPRNGFCPD